MSPPVTPALSLKSPAKTQSVSFIPTDMGNASSENVGTLKNHIVFFPTPLTLPSFPADVFTKQNV